MSSTSEQPIDGIRMGPVHLDRGDKVEYTFDRIQPDGTSTRITHSMEDIVPWNGWIAMIDFMGYGAAMDHRGSRKVGEAVYLAHELFCILWKTYHCPSASVNFLRFADTILMYTEDDSNSSLADIISISTGYLSSAIGMGLPMRLGLTHGEIWVSEDSSRYLGKGISRAHEMEMNQAWAGGAIDPKLPERERQKVLDCDTGEKTKWAIGEYKIPFKGGYVSGYALNWPSLLTGTLSELYGRLNTWTRIDSPEVGGKINETMKFAGLILTEEANVHEGEILFSDSHYVLPAHGDFSTMEERRILYDPKTKSFD